MRQIGVGQIRSGWVASFQLRSNLAGLAWFGRGACRLKLASVLAGRDETGRDLTGRDGTGRAKTGRKETGQEGTGRYGTRRDGTRRDWTGRDGTGRDGTGRDAMERGSCVGSFRIWWGRIESGWVGSDRLRCGRVGTEWVALGSVGCGQVHGSESVASLGVASPHLVSRPIPSHPSHLTP